MPKRRYTKEDVYQALVEVYQQTNAAVHRSTLSSVFHIPLQVVDDHIKTLVLDERVVRRDRGKVEPMAIYPEPRSLSVTYMPDGFAKLEIGDNMLELSPRELIFLAKLMVGHVPNFSTERTLLRSGVPQLKFQF